MTAPAGLQSDYKSTADQDAMPIQQRHPPLPKRCPTTDGGSLQPPCACSSFTVAKRGVNRGTSNSKCMSPWGYEISDVGHYVGPRGNQGPPTRFAPPQRHFQTDSARLLQEAGQTSWKAVQAPKKSTARCRLQWELVGRI